MKRSLVVLTVFALVVGLCSIGNATGTRLSGFNGIGYVPDAEVDPMMFNPAFVLKNEGLTIIDDNMISWYSRTQKDLNYVWTGSNAASEENQVWNNFDSMGTTIGILGTLNDSMGLGFMISPMYFYNSYTDTEKSNVTWGPGAYSEEGSFNKSYLLGVPALNALFAFQMGKIGLGIDVGYYNLTMKDWWANTTNGVQDDSTYNQNRSVYSGLAGKLGVIIALNDSMDLGIAFNGGSMKSVQDGDYQGFTNDYYTDYTTTPTLDLGLGLSLEKKLSDARLLRMLVNASMSKDSTPVYALYEDNYTKAYGAAALAAYKAALLLDLSDLVDTTTTIEANCQASLVDQEEGLTKFVGLNIGTRFENQFYSEDDDTTAVPTGSWQEYEEIRTDNTPISLDIAAGIESVVATKFVLRGGVSANFFSLNTSSYLRTDEWNPETSAVASYIASQDSSWDISALDALQLTGGLGYKVSEKLMIDLGLGMDLVGLNLRFSKDNWNELATLQPTRSESQMTLNLNLSVTYKL